MSIKTARAIFDYSQHILDCVSFANLLIATASAVASAVAIPRQVLEIEAVIIAVLPFRSVVSMPNLSRGNAGSQPFRRVLL